jgi:hypothetical protein
MVVGPSHSVPSSSVQVSRKDKGASRRDAVTAEPVRSAGRGCPVFGRALVSRRISNGMLASRFDIGLMYGIRVGAVGVAFEPGASGIRCNGPPASLHMIRIVRPLWRALGPCWAGFNIIRHRRRSGEHNHESRESDLGMDEHSPISCSVVTRVCPSTQETGERCILFHSLAAVSSTAIGCSLKRYSGAMHDLAQERLWPEQLRAPLPVRFGDPRSSI